MKRIAEQFEQGIDRLFRSLNAFFERCEAYGKQHAVGIGRAVHILERAKRYLAPVLLLYVTIFQLDGYRYLLSVDTTHPELYTFGVLIRCFILPVGALIGLMVSLGRPLRPFGRFLKRLAKGVAFGILITAAATGFWGYCFEYSIVMVVFACLTAAWIVVLLAEKLLRFLFLESAEGQDGNQSTKEPKAAPKEDAQDEK